MWREGTSSGYNRNLNESRDVGIPSDDKDLQRNGFGTWLGFKNGRMISSKQ